MSIAKREQSANMPKTAAHNPPPRGGGSSGGAVPSQIPVLHATWDDMMQPFERFVEKHERLIGKVGLAKIVPPEDWTPRSKGYPEDLDYSIERCIKQEATGSRGLWR